MDTHNTHVSVSIEHSCDCAKGRKQNCLLFPFGVSVDHNTSSRLRVRIPPRFARLTAELFSLVPELSPINCAIVSKIFS